MCQNYMHILAYWTLRILMQIPRSLILLLGSTQVKRCRLNPTRKVRQMSKKYCQNQMQLFQNSDNQDSGWWKNTAYFIMTLFSIYKKTANWDPDGGSQSNFDWEIENLKSRKNHILNIQQFEKLKLWCKEEHRFFNINNLCESKTLEVAEEVRATVLQNIKFEYRDLSILLDSFAISVVAAHLRSLRSDDPLSKGHPRPIKQRIKLQRQSNVLMNYICITDSLIQI